MYADASTSAKRQFPRLRLQLEARLASGGRAWCGVTDQVSLRGCRVVFGASESAPGAEERVRVRITFPSGTTTEIDARVVTTSPAPGGFAVALEFARVDPSLRAFLLLHLSARARHESERLVPV